MGSPCGSQQGGYFTPVYAGRSLAARTPGSEPEKQRSDLGVEMASGLLADVFDRLRVRPAAAVGTFGDQGIINIHHREDAGRQWNLPALQAARVAAAVPFLVMTVGDIERAAQIGNA